MKKHIQHYLLMASLMGGIYGLPITSYAYSDLERMPVVQDSIRVTGIVVDESNQPIKGATVTIAGQTGGSITGEKGDFFIPKVHPLALLEVAFLGKETKIVPVEGKLELRIVLVDKINALDEVTIVAFSTQKKESVLSAITTVKPTELRVPASNLTTALAGRVAGMISYQQSGEPGQDNARFFIRGITSFGADAKKDPLILIDNVELSTDDLARLNVDDIASFSIMKDAAATSLYGARGANGVILVTTKEGREGKAQLNLRMENSFSSPTNRVALADPLTYMRLGNEAVSTRDPLAIEPYSQEKIAMTQRGLHPTMYPSTNWYDIMLKPVTQNQRYNMSISGGGKVARYYVAGSLTQDHGNLNVDKRNNFNSNIDLKKYTIRSNVNINLTSSTEAIIRMNGSFDDYTGPLSGGASVYQNVLRTNPVFFLPSYQPDAATLNSRHILFGNYGEGNHINPYADMLKGYKDYNKSLMLVQLELKQDLAAIAKGLKARILFNTNRYSEFDILRQYKPFYYTVNRFDQQSGDYQLRRINPAEGSEWIDYQEGGKYINTTMYMESAVDYNTLVADKHSLSGLLVFVMREFKTANGSRLQLTLPSRNLGLSGRFAYNYDSKYFLEANFGYNGSERFSKKERWGFFPSIGGAWLISNESFFDGVRDLFPVLKVRGTYGLVGNEQIGSAEDRFYYLSQVNMETNSRGFTFGRDLNHSIGGVEITRYANENIGWEIAYKSNIGIELSVGKDFTIIADMFNERRTNILIDRIIPAAMGLNAGVKANLGEAKSRGIDAEVNYQRQFGNDWWVTGRGSFTYAKGTVSVWEEPDYTNTPWISRVNRPIGQVWGLIAERLFVDEHEVNNSPTQFGEYMAGDIKYRDINGDGKISDLDYVPIGHPTIPEMNYGFGASIGFKNWDFSLFFQGSARQSFWIDPYQTAPFINTLSGVIGSNALLDAYANSYWSESNRNAYALWPRLSNTTVTNNIRTNTWFMQDATFIRLKSAEFGYSLPTTLSDRLKMSNFRIYVSGLNLLSFSGFKLWDPEMAGNGLGYPVQRVFNLGLNVNF